MSNKTLLTAPAVRRRYDNVSDMTLWRWLHDQKLLFPRPIYIRRRRYWLADELDAFDAAQRAAGA